VLRGHHPCDRTGRLLRSTQQARPPRRRRDYALTPIGGGSPADCRTRPGSGIVDVPIRGAADRDFLVVRRTVPGLGTSWWRLVGRACGASSHPWCPARSRVPRSTEPEPEPEPEPQGNSRDGHHRQCERRDARPHPGGAQLPVRAGQAPLQWRIRLLVLAFCNRAGDLRSRCKPTDLAPRRTLFGRWMHATGGQVRW